MIAEAIGATGLTEQATNPLRNAEKQLTEAENALVVALSACRANVVDAINTVKQGNSPSRAAATPQLVSAALPALLPLSCTIYPCRALTNS